MFVASFTWRDLPSFPQKSCWMWVNLRNPDDCKICVMLVISRGTGVLLLSVHIRVRSAGSGGNKVHGFPFISFGQQIYQVFLPELGLDQWTVSLLVDTPLRSWVSISVAYVGWQTSAKPFTDWTQPLCSLCSMQMSWVLSSDVSEEDPSPKNYWKLH